MFENLLLKHLSFTNEDFEEFDSNEEAFIQMDLEENDNETWRRAAFNLVWKLSIIFPEKMNDMTQGYMSKLVDEFN